MLKLNPSWKRVHMVGMGGAGMSAIARVLTQAGITVTGSDVRESAVLEGLRAIGIRADVGHRARQAEGADVLIITNAVAPGNAEVEYARANGIPVLWRGEALAQIVGSLRTIAVSGTHGKTTTSGMVATILAHAGQNPTYLLGSDLAGRGSGGHLGEGDVAVVEADEAYRSFLWLKPSISVVTNIDRDHVDHYESWEALQEAFSSFMARSTEAVIVCADDARAMQIAGSLATCTYGFSEAASVRADALQSGAGGSDFTLFVDGEDKGPVHLQVAGRHNVQNALGAAAACLGLGLDVATVAAGLAAFGGVSRRFEYRGMFEGAHLVDDYAHHPAEIEATLSAARWGPWKRVVAVFQPHLYSRTQALWKEFGASLSAADVVVVTDVYGAREDPVPGVTGKLIVDALWDSAPGLKVAYTPRLDDAASYIRSMVQPEDLILTLGAGDITTLHDRLIGDPPADR
ncbi:MAG TPA: UDP-N-acetylmuramate--L-alanine ligase [Actinomycetota bacterium]|nr:UDP-N-acetylmuramate--L-alanine ligase [Actinomycetota bacterium]